ncbi:MAG: 2-haloacid dehalogenase [Paraglaciecola psychrophila]|jgi:2-haloacid dehalogenase
MSTCDVVVFDLGNVLIDFDPLPVYRDYFGDDSDGFAAFCASGRIWEILNHGHNIIGSWDTGFDELIRQRPAWRDEVELFRSDWFKFLLGPMTASVAVLQELDRAAVPLYGLTNWPAQVWPPRSHADTLAQHNYDFLQSFRDIVVSGIEQLRKPDPALYRLALERWQLTPERCLFVDDLLDNVEAARDLGMAGHHFHSAAELRDELLALGLI